VAFGFHGRNLRNADARLSAVFGNEKPGGSDRRVHQEQ